VKGGECSHLEFMWKFKLVNNLEGVIGVSEGLERRVACHCLRNWRHITCDTNGGVV
jgi:hypothetical protein